MTTDWTTPFAQDTASGLKRTYDRVLSRPEIAWLGLLGSLIVTALLSLIFYNQLRDQDELRFNAEVEALHKAVAERLERYVQVLRAAGGLFAANRTVLRKEWRTYISRLELAEHYRGLYALGYIEQVDQGELPRFLEQTRKDSAGDFDQTNFQVWPLDHRTNLYVVKFVEPLTRNRAALGFDIGSEPLRRQAADEARDTGRATLTRKIELVQAPDLPAALLLLPVYQTGVPPDNLRQRRASLKGWIYAAFVMEDLMHGIPRAAHDLLNLEIFDGRNMAESNRLYGRGNPTESSDEAAHPFLTRTTVLSFENCVWTLRYQSQSTLHRADGYLLPFVIGVGGVCISLLLFSVFRLLSTTRQRSLALAHEMTRKFRLQERAMSSASNGIFILDATQLRQPIIYANSAFTRITGYSTEESLGDETRWLLEGAEENTELMQMRAALKSGNTRRTVLREYRKDGTQFWAEFNLSPVRDEGGCITHHVGIVDDVTDRMRAEISLKQSQERLALVIQGSYDGIWDWDVTTNQVYFSPRWKSMLGYEDHEVENALSGWERLLHPDDHDRALGVIEDYFQGQTATYELEHRLRHKDGTYRWILARGVALRDEKGKPVRMAGSHVDLTERKEAENQLRQAYKELTHSQKSLKETLEKLQASHQELKSTQLQLIQSAKLESIGTLAAGVAHEVKNPLQTILMGLDFVSYSLSDAHQDVAEALADMRDAVKRANGIIGELLQLSASSKFNLQAEDFVEVIQRSLRLVHSKLLAGQIEVVEQFPEPLPRVLIDKTKIEQLLINLILNATQAMSHPGTLTISARAARFGENLTLNNLTARHFKPGESVVLAEIRDTGHGIPETVLPKIFDPFFTTKAVGVGTGLGLPIVKKIIDLHQGHIEINNHSEGGAIVTLIFKTADQPGSAG